MKNLIELNQLVKVKGKIKHFSGEHIHVQVQYKVILFHQSEIEILKSLELDDFVLVEGIVKEKYDENIHIQVKNKVIVINKEDVVLTCVKKEKDKQVEFKKGA